MSCLRFKADWDKVRVWISMTVYGGRYYASFSLCALVLTVPVMEKVLVDAMVSSDTGN